MTARETGFSGNLLVLSPLRLGNTENTTSQAATEVHFRGAECAWSAAIRTAPSLRPLRYHDVSFNCGGTRANERIIHRNLGDHVKSGHTWSG
jgi:hypothetical protein